MSADQRSQYLQGKVIIVTGAGGGFGKLIAEKCAAGGTLLGDQLAEPAAGPGDDDDLALQVLRPLVR